MNKSALETVSLWLAGDVEDTPPFDALRARQDVFTMTRQAQAAVLAPADGGSWPHDFRAALATRIATANNNPYLANIYGKAAAGSPYAALAAVDYVPSDLVQQKVVTFMDKVANNAKAIAAEDISALQQAGVADADIVRLCELNAFLAYQIRVAAGLASLIEGEQA
ncbi:uncharacterized protein YciW [Paenochrobactrum gallinarii]|uniref:Uncharacterized protein YciW n=1 Tax=Paenochrobactrum gallinarii TaxID=643673 RepID=A0A841M0P5_9HYPH|nr:hypothetical protein [Paenochrobactrum gallinarii]MBB6261409.1 uncharacterized protein YciW [Paenochrobactrum gallinarii]